MRAHLRTMRFDELGLVALEARLQTRAGDEKEGRGEVQVAREGGGERDS